MSTTNGTTNETNGTTNRIPALDPFAAALDNGPKPMTQLRRKQAGGVTRSIRVASAITSATKDGVADAIEAAGEAKLSQKTVVGAWSMTTSNTVDGETAAAAFRG